MYCTRCGKLLGEGSAFCQYCGARLVIPTSSTKIITRSRRDRKIAGVCAGVAEYLGLDVTLVRLVWLFCLILAGTGLLAYIIAWIVIPDEPEYAMVNKTT